MNWKRFLPLLLLTYVVIILLDFVYNFIFLQKAFIENSQYWRSPKEMQNLVLVGWLIMILCITLVALLFARFGKSGIYNGLEFGLLLGLSSFVLICGFTTIVPWSPYLLIAWAGQWFVNDVIIGFLFGWLYKGKAVSV